MPLSNFTRPPIPYANAPLPNDRRFNIITRLYNRPMTADEIDGEFNKLTDNCNILDRKIEDVQVGIITGSDNPLNAGKFLTTDGADDPTLSWTKVTNSHVDDGGLSGLKITPLTIGTDQLDNGIITPDKVPNNSIPYSKTDFEEGDIPYLVINVPDGAIGGEKITGKSITQQQQGLLSVGSPELIDDAVIEPKIADNAVTTPKISDNAVTTPKISDNAITTEKVNDQAITLSKIAPGVLPAAATKADQIAANSTTVYANPAVQQFHPSALSFRGTFNGSIGGTNPPIEGFNITSIQQISQGIYQVNLGITFTTNTWTVDVSCSRNTLDGFASAAVVSQTNNSVTIILYSSPAFVTSCSKVYISGCGVIA